MKLPRLRISLQQWTDIASLDPSIYERWVVAGQRDLEAIPFSDGCSYMLQPVGHYLEVARFPSEDLALEALVRFKLCG